MKIKLMINEARADEIREQLEAFGIEIDDNADLILSEQNAFISHLSVRDNNGNRVNIPVNEIIYIESYGHDVEVHTDNGCYNSSDRLYQLCNMMNPQEFLRISNSVIISKKHVKEIRPSLSMKFVLKLSNGTLVDVTRSYYNTFKESFKI